MGNGAKTSARCESKKKERAEKEKRNKNTGNEKRIAT
jgi:hypothetical protein